MANKGSRRSHEELIDLAIRHYELGEPVDSLAADRGLDQSTIRRWLARAKREGLVKTLVVPPLSDEGTSRLSQEVRYAFELEDVVTVPGREDVLEAADDTGPKEAVVFSVAQAAARYLEEHLTNRDILLVPWGRMTNYIARQIRPPRPLPGLTVVPIEGVLGVAQDPFEANILASAIASKFGGHSLLLPAPAVVDGDVGQTIESLPLVKRVTDLYARATAAIISLAPPDPERSTVVTMGLLSAEQVKEMMNQGAVGEIATHWWFDGRGRPVNQERIHTIGLGLAGLSAMVRRRAKVVAVVGASRERVPPLKVALRHGLANVLITDHVSARLLVADAQNPDGRDAF